MTETLILLQGEGTATLVNDVMLPGTPTPVIPLAAPPTPSAATIGTVGLTLTTAGTGLQALPTLPADDTASIPVSPPVIPRLIPITTEPAPPTLAQTVTASVEPVMPTAPEPTIDVETTVNAAGSTIAAPSPSAQPGSHSPLWD